MDLTLVKLVPDVPRGASVVQRKPANSVSALLVTLGKNGLEPPTVLDDDLCPLQFPKDTGVKEAALLLIREKNNRYTMVRVSN